MPPTCLKITRKYQPCENYNKHWEPPVSTVDLGDGNEHFFVLSSVNYISGLIPNAALTQARNASL